MSARRSEPIIAHSQAPEAVDPREGGRQEDEREWNAATVDDTMALRAWLAAVVGTGRLVPLVPGTRTEFSGAMTAHTSSLTRSLLLPPVSPRFVRRS